MPFRPERGATPSPDLRGAVARLAALAQVPSPAVAGPEREALLGLLPWLGGLRRIDGSLQGLLRRLVLGPRFDGEPDGATLPKPARKALKSGEVLASADADVWILEERPDGTARVSHAHPEGFEVLGETIAAWLTAETIRLEDAARPRSKGADRIAGKPAIDAALAALAAEDVTTRLAALAPGKNDTRWDYLLRAVEACGPVWPAKTLQALEGRLLARVLTGALHDTDDEACIVEPDDEDLDGVNPIYVDRYPEEARKVLEAGHFVASSGPELWILTRDAKGQKMSWGIELFHAAYDGFEALGSVEGWLAHEVERLAAGAGG